jgi:hypothetical protein
MKFIATGGAAPDVRREASDLAVDRERNKLRPATLGLVSSWEYVTFSIKRKSDQRLCGRLLRTLCNRPANFEGYHLSQDEAMVRYSATRDDSGQQDTRKVKMGGAKT